VPHVQRAGSECRAPRTQGPLVKLLVEGSIATAFIRLVEWRDRKSIVTFDPHNQPINFSSPALHVRGPGEMQGTWTGPLVILVEGFHSLHGMHSFGQWRDRKSIVTLTQPTHQFLALRAPRVRGLGVRCEPRAL
jgi:hypothetical protein